MSDHPATYENKRKPRWYPRVFVLDARIDLPRYIAQNPYKLIIFALIAFAFVKHYFK